MMIHCFQALLSSSAFKLCFQALLSSSAFKLCFQFQLAPLHLVQRNTGVNAYAWPHNIDIATHAASSLVEILDTEKPKRPLRVLNWVGFVDIAQVTNEGKLPEANQFLGHHVGCLYGRGFHLSTSPLYVSSLGH